MGKVYIGVGWNSGYRYDGLPLDFGPFPLYSCYASLGDEQLFFLEKNPDTTLGLYLLHLQVFRSVCLSN
jgi:hypothetical protein